MPMWLFLFSSFKPGRLRTFLTWAFTAAMCVCGGLGGPNAFAVSFSVSTLQGMGGGVQYLTSLQFGPDGRLYVAQVDGLIRVYSVQRVGPNSYQVTTAESISLVKNIPNHNDDGTLNSSLNYRQVTGLTVVGTAANPVIYVSSSDPRIGGGAGGELDLGLDTNSGIISRLTWNGTTWDKVDLVRGLPRSEENHASNGMHYDAANHRLLLAQGGNSNAGAPSIAFAYLSETALAAAILSVDLTAIEAMPIKVDINGQRYIYDLPTLNDPNPNRAHNPDGSNVNDPFGGNDGLNQAKIVPGGPVQVYAPGFRNAYDLVMTVTPGRSGRLYTFDNGANPNWGGYPVNEGQPSVSNQYPEGEPGFVNNLDTLHYITGPGYYGGHPNPIRANPTGAGWFHYDNDASPGQQKKFESSPTSDWPPVPVGMANPVEADFRQPGPENGALVTYDSSVNGLAEYTATNFSGAMQGDLIAAAYNGTLLRVKLSQDGTQAVGGAQIIASEFGTIPLDVTAPRVGYGDAFAGTLWVCHYSDPGQISILEPSDFDSGGGGQCLGLDDFGIDEDGDGYSNGDEIANGTDPCSGASKPRDFDQDFISDLLDPDDDNDGIPDVKDRFQINPHNGLNVPIPVHYELFNSTGIGFFGVGFTGLMMNEGEDYLLRYHPDNIVAGGAAGLVTIGEVGSGTALGSSNNLDDGYQFGLNVDEFTGPFVVRGRIAGPFFGGSPQGSQSHGIYIGNGDQDNYLAVLLNANSGAGGMKVVYEQAGTVISQVLYGIPGLLSAGVIDLYFVVDPVAGKVQPKFQVQGGALTPLGAPITLGGPVLEPLRTSKALAVGLMATSGSGPSFAATWDDFEATLLTNTAVAKVTIDPPENTIPTSSTYSAGSFKVQNLSTGGQRITSVTLDLRTAMLPDVVFDPTGTAGDSDFKDFELDSNDGIGSINGSFASPHNGVDSQDGYDQVVVTYSGFDPGESMSFSADIDPTSVKGSAGPGPNDAASISGLELVGSTVTVNFDDGSIQKTRLTHIPGSVDGSESLLTSNKPQTPGLQVPGRVAPFVTGTPQTVRITGPPGASATLLIAEAALYTAGVPNGGYDLDPFEANTLIQFTELNGVISAAGYWDVLVNLTKSNPDAGYHFMSAWLVNSDGTRGPASDTLIVRFDPSLASDTQPPTTPGNLTAANVTSSSVTLNWTASTDNVGVTKYDVSRGGVLLGSVTGLSYADSGLAPSSTFAYTVVARDAAGNSSGPAAINVSTATTTAVVRIHAGGGAFTDNAGNTWSADTGYNTGTTYSTGSAINNTVDDALYQTERSDPSGGAELQYSFNVPNGNYEVRLHFAEIYPGTFGIGLRVFDVLMEGNLVVDNLDIYSQVGANSALVISVPVTVSDGQLNIEFVHGVENPKISAIEVLSVSLPPTISNITDQTTTVNTATAAIPFTINDTDTPVNNLTLSRGSSNTTLVPTNNIVFGGSGTNRTVTITPAAHQIGTATITVTVSDGLAAANDSFLVTVNKGQLTVMGITAGNKVYDGTTTATLNTGSAALAGVVSPDVVTLSTAGAVGVFNTSTAGNGKNVQVAGLAIGGADAGNYTLTQPTALANITKAGLTVTANNQSRAYGATNPALTGTLTGVQGGDNITATYTTAATPASPVGNYAIVPALVDPTGKLGNYNVTAINGFLTITKAGATVTLGSLQPVYNGTAKNVTTATGPAGLTVNVTYNGNAAAPTNAGGYLVVGTIVDANYQGAVTNTLLITKAMLTVTADNKGRAYGAVNPPLTATIAGFVNGETLTTSGVTGSPAVSTTATAASPVGSHPITAVVGTLAAANYSFSFAAGTLTVTKAGLTVTADNKSRAYGAANPMLTATIAGFVNGETLATSGVTGSPALGTTAIATSPVGSYPITAAMGSLGAANYSFNFANGALTVFNARPAIRSLKGAGTTNAVITWSAISNVTYRVQYRPDLGIGNWLDLSPNVTAINDTASAVDNLGGAKQRFYRILVVP